MLKSQMKRNEKSKEIRYRDARERDVEIVQCRVSIFAKLSMSANERDEVAEFRG
jgi:hypothetical protein